MKDEKLAIKISYSGLDWDDRKEIREFIEEFEKNDWSDKREIHGQLKKSLGPINSATCPYCGK